MNESNEINNDKELYKKVSFIENKVKEIEEENKIMISKISENNSLLNNLKNNIQKILIFLDKKQNENKEKRNIKSKENTPNDEIINNENSKNEIQNQINNVDENKDNDKLEPKQENINKNNKFNFHYLITENLELELTEILKRSIMNANKTLNEDGGFERQEINEENKKIKDKILLQINKYSNKEKNYILKKAEYFRRIGILVRFSHELGIYIFQILLEIFKNNIGFHSLFKDKVRLYYSTWIKKQLNEICFKKIAKNKNIQNQLNNLIQFENNERDFFIDELLPNLCKLYFHCYLTDIIVDIIYAKEDEEFNWNNMVENLINMKDDKKVLFTYLPGLNVKNQFLDNSQILVVAYPSDNPSKINIQKPAFYIESTIQININIQINEVSFTYKKLSKSTEKNKLIVVEFEVNLGINIPKWDSLKYKFNLIDCNNYIFEGTKISLEETYYGKCICQVFINNIKVKESSPKILDLRVKK